jgi:hypothetical protein
MSESSIFDDPQVAGALVRLLRDKPFEADMECLSRLLDERPGELLDLCQQNLIILRTLAALEARGVSLEGEAAARQEKERERIEQGLATIGSIAQQFERADVPFMVIKTGDHFPDQGHDIDLLLGDGGAKAECLLRDELGASPLERSVSEVLSAKSNWRCGPTTIEMHVGRLGQVGEHRQLAEEIFSQRQRARIGSLEAMVPSAEGRMILAMLQRIYRHFNFRICDLVNVSGLVEDETLSWETLWRLCRLGGIDYGVGLGIAMVADQLSRLDEKLALPDSGPIPQPCPHPISFRRGYYRFSLRGVVPGVFARQLGGSVRQGAILQSSRLAILGFLMAFVGLNIRFFPGISVWRKLW